MPAKGEGKEEKKEEKVDQRKEYIKKRVLTAFSHVQAKKFEKVYNNEDNLYVLSF